MIKASQLTQEYYSTGDVASMMGVVTMTIINYDKQGKMHFDRTPTNRRQITRENLISYLDSVGLFLDDSSDSKFDAVYCRVSTQKQAQRGDLDSQITSVLSFACTKNPVNLKVYKDVGSGLNDNRKDLMRLIDDIEHDRINRVFITYKDRLTRFGFNYLSEICKHHGTTIVQVSSEVVEKSVQEELAEDLCAIIHSFSGKLYGLRKSQLKDINEKVSKIKEVNDDETG